MKQKTSGKTDKTMTLKNDATFLRKTYLKKYVGLKLHTQFQTRSSEEERRVDALALRAEERRDKLR